MKQLSILVSACLFTSPLFAQLNKGQWLAGGTAGFSYENMNNGNIPQYAYSLKQTTEQLAPVAGYFILGKLCVGARVSSSFSNGTYSYSPADSLLNGKSTSYGISVAPFIRYYFLPKTNKVNLLADISYAWAFTKQTNTTHGSKYSNRQNYPAYTIAAGPSFFVNPKTAVEITAAYSYINDKPESQTTGALMLNAGFQIYLGK